MMPPVVSARIRRGSARIAGVVLVLMALAACSSSGEEVRHRLSRTRESAPTSAPSTLHPLHVSEAGQQRGIVSGKDVTILERLQSPTTAEVWQTPVEISNLALFTHTDGATRDDYRYFQIGSRDGSRIIAVVEPHFTPLLVAQSIVAVIESDGTSVRMIMCPSARESDGCLSFSNDWVTAGRSLDTATHYDSLTYPRTVEPVPGWTLNVAPLAASPWAQTFEAFGEASSFPAFPADADALDMTGHDGQRRVIASLGDSSLVEWRSPSPIRGLVESYLTIETPYGANIASRMTFTSDWYGVDAVTWDDGRDTFTHQTPWGGGTETYPVRSANLTCVIADDALATTFKRNEWVKAGTHRTGRDVYVPKPGGNPLSTAVFNTMKDTSWADEVDPDFAYPYTSYADFEAARSVFAWQRPDGEWVIAIDAFAAQYVYECA